MSKLFSHNGNSSKFNNHWQSKLLPPRLHRLVYFKVCTVSKVENPETIWSQILMILKSLEFSATPGDNTLLCCQKSSQYIYRKTSDHMQTTGKGNKWSQTGLFKVSQKRQEFCQIYGYKNVIWAISQLKTIIEKNILGYAQFVNFNCLLSQIIT